MGRQEWRFLAWTCGCAASYATDAGDEAKSDVEIARCAIHGAPRKRRRPSTR
jgi:hypothetical protein